MNGLGKSFMSAVMLCHDDEISFTPIETISFIEFFTVVIGNFKTATLSLSFFRRCFRCFLSHSIRRFFWLGQALVSPSPQSTTQRQRFLAPLRSPFSDITALAVQSNHSQMLRDGSFVAN